MGLEVKQPIDHRTEDFCSEVGVDGPVAVEGGKTRWNLNGLPSENTRLLKAPKGILSAKPEEMTVTVLAGTPVSELHKELQTLGQRTCLPDRGGTVGGALAVGENDLSVLGKGRVRDSVLQLRYVSADGQIISSGAPVVKNVSGFNLHKLMVGSFGTLGLFAEITLRQTRHLPRPNGSLLRPNIHKIFSTIYTNPQQFFGMEKQHGFNLRAINEM
jgi:glycolate oxidase FAD binding subunit